MAGRSRRIPRPPGGWRLRLALAAAFAAPLPAAATAVAAPTAAAAAEDDAARRCLALVAYAEAAGEGAAGMSAVMEVMRNRATDPRFPKGACAVAVQPGQFQPVGERPDLKVALLDPASADLVAALGGAGSVDRGVLKAALALAGGDGGGAATRGAPAAAVPPDPTGGALYFVNPDFMDPAHCPWFAGLKRTAQIGAHVFMAHYAPGERRRGPALDCSTAGRFFVARPGGGRTAVAGGPARRPPPPPPQPAFKPGPPEPVRIALGGFSGRSAVGAPGGRGVGASLDRMMDYRRGADLDRRAAWSRPTP